MGRGIGDDSGWGWGGAVLVEGGYGGYLLDRLKKGPI